MENLGYKIPLTGATVAGAVRRRLSAKATICKILHARAAAVGTEVAMQSADRACKAYEHALELLADDKSPIEIDGRGTHGRQMVEKPGAAGRWVTAAIPRICDGQQVLMACCSASKSPAATKSGRASPRCRTTSKTSVRSGETCSRRSISRMVQDLFATGGTARGGRRQVQGWRVGAAVAEVSRSGREALSGQAHPGARKAICANRCVARDQLGTRAASSTATPTYADRGHGGPVCASTTRRARARCPRGRSCRRRIPRCSRRC